MKENKITIDLLKGIPNAENIFAIFGRYLGFKQRKYHNLC